MSRTCALTGKRPRSGNNRPFSLKATKRVFRPNLFKKKVYNPRTGRMEKVKLSAKAIKTMKKWEKEMFGEELINAPVVEHEAGEGKHTKKEKLTPKQKKELAAAEEAQKKEAAKPGIVKEMEGGKE
jgi:large subunit ribosomal protein L28